MQGKTRKGNTYYACGYRISYGDKAAHALGHDKWQYVREDRITNLIDHFFATQIFGPARVARFKAQHADLARDLDDRDDGQRQHLISQLTDIDQRLQRQLAAIEAGVDAVLVGDRIRALKPNASRSNWRSPTSTTTGTDGPAWTSTTPAPSSTDYPTSTTRSPPPTPNSAARSTTPSASASRSTATKPRYD
jgi:hypothetical protein